MARPYNRTASPTLRGESPGDRAMDDREFETRDVEEMERDEFDPSMAMTNKLPVPPTIPGYSYLWVPYQQGGVENLQLLVEKLHRVTGGYEYVSPSEIPGFSHFTSETGSVAGRVVAYGNVLLKIKNSNREKIQRHIDHLSSQQMQGISGQLRDEDGRIASVSNKVSRTHSPRVPVSAE